MMLITDQSLAINESNWFRWSLQTSVLSQGVLRLPQQRLRKFLHRLANGDPVKYLKCGAVRPRLKINSGNMSEQSELFLLHLNIIINIE